MQQPAEFIKKTDAILANYSSITREAVEKLSMLTKENITSFSPEETAEYLQFLDLLEQFKTDTWQLFQSFDSNKSVEKTNQLIANHADGTSLKGFQKFFDMAKTFNNNSIFAKTSTEKSSELDEEAQTAMAYGKKHQTIASTYLICKEHNVSLAEVKKQLQNHKESVNECSNSFVM